VRATQVPPVFGHDRPPDIGVVEEQKVVTDDRTGAEALVDGVLGELQSGGMVGAGPRREA
jgi:hypothetical protein